MLFTFDNVVINIEAAAQRYSVNKVFLEISQNLQKNICAKVFFLIVAGLGPVTLLKNRL